MDDKDIYNQFKNAFLLANYLKVFELFKSFNENTFQEYKAEVYFIITRSYLALGSRKTTEITELINSNETIFKYLKVMELFYTKWKDGKSVKDIVTEMEKLGLAKTDHLNKLITAYACYEKDDYKTLNTYEANWRKNDMELHLLVFLIFLKMNRLDLAQKKYLNFSIYDDEDLFVHLAHIYLLIFQAKYEDAIFLIDEIKEKFQESLKLLNLKAACYMHLKQYENANNLLLKIINLITNKEQYKDKEEFEVSLTNIIVLSINLGLPYEEYLTVLKEASPDSLILMKIRGVDKFFDQIK